MLWSATTFLRNAASVQPLEVGFKGFAGCAGALLSKAWIRADLQLISQLTPSYEVNEESLCERT